MNWRRIHLSARVLYIGYTVPPLMVSRVSAICCSRLLDEFDVANQNQFCGICGTNVFVKAPTDIGINVFPHGHDDRNANVGTDNRRRDRSIIILTWRPCHGDTGMART